MGWTAPRTFVTAEIITSAILNTHVRDNLNDLDRRTTVSGVFEASSATTSSATYATPAGIAGPAVAVPIGASGLALMSIHALIQTNTAGNAGWMSIAVSGASTIAASDATALHFSPPANNIGGAFSGQFMASGLTPGSNTFTAKYKVTTGAAVGTFSNRWLIVTPLGS